MVISHQQQNANQQPGMNNHPMSTSGMSASALPHPVSHYFIYLFIFINIIFSHD